MCLQGLRAKVIGAETDETIGSEVRNRGEAIGYSGYIQLNHAEELQVNLQIKKLAFLFG